MTLEPGLDTYCTAMGGKPLGDLRHVLSRGLPAELREFEILAASSVQCLVTLESVKKKNSEPSSQL